MVRGLEKRQLGNTGNEITFIGFGALEIGRDWGLGDLNERLAPGEESAGITLNEVLDFKINMIDTASAYHQSEVRIGKFISDRRKEYFLSSKCGEHNNEPNTYYDFSYKAIKQSIDNSLLRLKVDYIDLMQIHFGPDQKQVLDDGETVAAMKSAKKEGKIKLLGASTGGSIAKRCIDSGDFDVMQLEYSLLNRNDEELIKLCGEDGVGVLIRGGLAYGKLTPRVILHLNKEIREEKKIRTLLSLVNGDAEKLTALALQFLYRNSDISSVLIGSKNIQHIKRNFELLDDNVDADIMNKAIAITK